MIKLSNVNAPEKMVDFLYVDISFCSNAMTIRLVCDDPDDPEVRMPGHSNANIFGTDHWELFFYFKEREFPLLQIVVDWQGKVEFRQIRLNKKEPRRKTLAVQTDVRAWHTAGYAEVSLILNLNQLEGLRPNAPPVPWNVCYCPADGSGIYSHVALPQINFLMVEYYTLLDFSKLNVTEVCHDFDAALMLEIQKPAIPSPWICHSVFSSPSMSGEVVLSESECVWRCAYSGGNHGYAGIAATVRDSLSQTISHHSTLHYVHPDIKALDIELESFYLDGNVPLRCRLPHADRGGSVHVDVYRLNEPDCVLQRQVKRGNEASVFVDVEELPAGCYLARGGVRIGDNTRPFTDVVFIKGGGAFPFSIILGREYTVDMGGHILGLGHHIDPQSRAPQDVINAINEAGGIAIIAHPDSSSFRFSHEWLLRLKGYLGIEIYNYRDSPEEDYCGTWDTLLTAGKRVYGFAADDAHSANGVAHGFIQVGCRSNAPGSVLKALSRGQFYASTGVDIVDYERKGRTITLSVAEPVKAVVLVDDGQVYKAYEGIQLKCEIPESATYLRIMLTNRTGGKAWLQPEFPEGEDWSCFGVKKWKKVNLHTHTTISDGALPPWAMALLYLKKGYNALALTDHF